MSNNPRLCLIAVILVGFTILSLGGLPARAEQPPDLIHQPYQLNTGLVSRSISFENPTGAPGEGGKAASKLGPGRKGMAQKILQPGQTFQLGDIEGPGTIRHLWMTTMADPAMYRSLVLRAWWEGQTHPSIECPLGDLFGGAHGTIKPYQSAVHSIGPSAGLNLWLPMPFAKHAKLTLANEGSKAAILFYQLTYTLGDKHPADVGRLHVLFRRENPTSEKKDFEILPLRKNPGRYVGVVLGIRNLHPARWWGEGELKVYMDGDTKFPTIVGTGSEDYVGLSWGVQLAQYMYHGCSLNEKNFVSMYRWHLADPIAWQKEARITIQQIAATMSEGLMETQDDWSCATFWYEPVPSAALPPMPDVKARTADIWSDAVLKK